MPRNLAAMSVEERREFNRQKKARQRANAAMREGKPVRMLEKVEGCQCTGKLHDCDTFPLSPAVNSYLQSFDAFLAAPDGVEAYGARQDMEMHARFIGIG